MASIVKTIAARVPWWGKVGAKIFLARLPVSYQSWKRLHLFEHGAMQDPAYAYGVFQRHFDAAQSRKTLNNFVGLELGPGDSLLSAMAAHAHGSSAYYLVDAAWNIDADIKNYRAMAGFLVAQGFPMFAEADLESVETILERCRACYVTSGLDSLRAIPTGSVDFVWSHSVLQHVRYSAFLQTLRELRRIHRPDGVSSHWIDLQDCMGGALNNLRFGDAIWESSLSSGFYTNRIRYSQMLSLFREAGFEADVLTIKRWDRLPTPRGKLNTRFRDLSDEDLLVRCFHVILMPVRHTN
ncbi:MAG TPA: methyltransferase domain-containing protein [Nitrospira sp.]|nr:methyltransferase domain-containing protein [Nitrospira sp.]